MTRIADNQPLTGAELVDILRESAGDAEGVDLAGGADGDLLDVPFADLGYDSIALLETAGQIERTYGVTLDDDVVQDATTPRRLLDLVNDRIGRQAS